MEAKGSLLLGEILVDLGFINLPQVNEARRRQMLKPNVLLGEYLVELGYVTPSQLLEALSRQAEDLCRDASPSTRDSFTRGLPAKVIELCQLSSLPLFQAIANQLEVGFYLVGFGERRADDRVLFVNQTFAFWIGMKPEDFLDKPGLMVINFAARFFDDPQDFLRRIQESVAKRPQPPTMVLEVAKPQPMRVEVRHLPLHTKAGELVGIAAFLRKI